MQMGAIRAKLSFRGAGLFRAACATGVLLIALPGCAQSRGPNVATQSPTNDELPPPLVQAEPTIAPNVGVETHTQLPQQQFVRIPEMKYSPEEQKLLDENKPRFDPLELYRPAPSINDPVSPFADYVQSASWGRGGTDGGIYPFRDMRTGAAPLEPAIDSAYLIPISRIGVYDFAPSPGLGPRSGVEIGTGPESHKTSNLYRSPH